ncbi:hypothetical protein SNEBB_003252 [Seison nebaliae]|nr:hypothetical protein SNEBB_003252 [Seison nebaliae]
MVSSLAGNKEEDQNQTIQSTEKADVIDVWKDILTEVSKQTQNEESSKTVIVLGDDDYGKTSLLQSLGVKSMQTGHPIEYLYSDNMDNETHEEVFIRYRILNVTKKWKDYLRIILTERPLDEIVIMIVGSITEPWRLLEVIQVWIDRIYDMISEEKLIDEKKWSELQKNLTLKYRSYVDVENEMMTSTNTLTSNNSQETTIPPQQTLPNLQLLNQLDGLTLTKNLGIPIVCVINKSDEIANVKNLFDYRDEHFDFLNIHLRRFCLSFGGTLIYFSSKEKKNTNTLKILMDNLCFNKQITLPPSIVDRDAIFIPSGWDSEYKLNMIVESLTSIDKNAPFTSVIKSMDQPSNKHQQSDKVLMALPNQDFLKKGYDNGLKSKSTSNTTPINKISNKKNLMVDDVSVGSEPATSTSTRTPQRNNKLNDAVLSDFFNSLLTKNKGGTSGSRTPVDGQHSRSGSSVSAASKRTPKPTKK